MSDSICKCGHHENLHFVIGGACIADGGKYVIPVVYCPCTKYEAAAPAADGVEKAKEWIRQHHPNCPMDCPCNLVLAKCGIQPLAELLAAYAAQQNASLQNSFEGEIAAHTLSLAALNAANAELSAREARIGELEELLREQVNQTGRVAAQSGLENAHLRAALLSAAFTIERMEEHGVSAAAIIEKRTAQQIYDELLASVKGRTQKKS